MTLATKLDWVAKRKMYQEYIDSEGANWQDEVMQSLDIEYHNVNPAQSLFYALEEAGEMERLIPHAEIARAMVVSPLNTRAHARSQIISKLIQSRSRDYVIDWDLVYLAKNRHLDLKNPFDTYTSEAESFSKAI
jgi:proteasome accessory factor A